jgi:hypothetical protein
MRLGPQPAHHGFNLVKLYLSDTQENGGDSGR